VVSENWDHEPIEDALDRRIKSHRPPEPSTDLLGRCLATVSGPRRRSDAATATPRALRPRARIALGAAGLAVGLLAAFSVFLFFPAGNGSKNLLAEVVRAFEEAPAFHIKRVGVRAGDTEVPGTQEVWVVRGVGRRVEVREGTKLVGVGVDNLRWRLQWDVERDYVIAWPSKMADPSARLDDDFELIPSQSLIGWGEKHKAEVVVERDELDGKEVEKVTVQWPGETEAGANVVWFDPLTHRPLKKRHRYDDGRITEIMIDYPAPDAVPEERFTLEIPRSALLEVNDPLLGRPLYSEGQTHPDLRNWTSERP